MRKIIILILLLCPLLLNAQRHFEDGIRIYTERVEPQTLFSVRLDDAFIDYYTDWLPLLDSLGIVASVPVVTDSVGSPSGDYMSWEQLLALQDSGWEIMSHGVGVMEWLYDGLTDAEIETQIRDSRDTLLAHGLNVNNLTPPNFSALSLVGREIARKYYRSSHAGYTMGLREDFNYPVIDQFNMCAMRGDLAGSYMAERANGVDSVKAAIDRGLLDETWGIYFLHRYTIPKAIGLREIIEYAQDSGISIVTIDQGLDIFEPYMTSGREFNVSERGVRISHAYGEGLTIADSATKIGIGAGFGNDDVNSVSIGTNANSNGTGQWRVDIGESAGKNGDGNSTVNVGRLSGFNSDMDAGVNIGYAANHTGIGLAPTFGGYESGSGNTGHYSTGWGYRTAKNNSGTRGTFFGREAGEDNSGDYVLGLGERALKDNTKDYIFEIKQGTANDSPLLKGFFDDRSFISGAPVSAVSDSEIDTNSVHMYLDEGNDKLMFRVRYSDGSYATGEVSLTPDP